MSELPNDTLSPEVEKFLSELDDPKSPLRTTTGKSRLERELEKGRLPSDARSIMGQRGDPRRILSEEEQQDALMREALAKDYGQFISDPDPTGSVDTGFAAETRMLPEVQESYAKLQRDAFILEGEDDPIGFTDQKFGEQDVEALKDEISFEEMMVEKENEEDKAWYENAFDVAGERARALGFGGQKTVAFAGGVPIKSPDKAEKFAEHGGLAGGATELGLFALDIAGEIRKGVFGTLEVAINPVDALTDFANGLSYLVGKDSDAETTVLSKFHYMAGSQSAQESIKIINEYLKKSARTVLPIRDDETFNQFWHSVRNPLAVPEEDMDALNTGLAVFGLFAPLAGAGTTVQGGRLLNKYTRNTFLAAHIAKKIGVGETWRTLPFREFYDLDLGKKIFPDMPNQLIYNDSGLKKRIKAFEDRNMPTDRARKKALNMRRDFIAGAGAASLYSVFDQMQSSELVSMFASVFGALTANTAAAYTRTAATAARFYAWDNFTAALSSSSRESRQRNIDFFKNSEAKHMNKYRKTFLRMNGMTNNDITEATRESLYMGNAAKKAVRELEEKGDTTGAKRLLDKYISDGVLDDKGRPHRFYLINTLLDSKYNRRTLEFGAMFRKNVLESQDGEQFQNMIDTVHKLMDNLSSVAPKAMEKFPLLLEQMTGFAALQAMRNALVNQAEFSAVGGRVINGDYLTEAEKYHQMLARQTSQLQEVLQEIRGSDAKESEFLMDFLAVVNQGVASKDLGYSQERVMQLKQLAFNPSNKRLEALEEYKDEMQALSQFDQVGDSVAAARHSRSQRTMLIEGFKERQTEASKFFKEIRANPEYRNLKITVDGFLTNLPKPYLEDLPRTLDNLITNFAQLDRVTSNRLQREIGFRSLKQDFNIPQNPTEEYYNGEFQKNLEFMVQGLEKTPEEKINIFERITQNADRVALTGNKNIEEGINIALLSLADEIEIPANVSIEAFMDIRSAMAQKQRAEWEAGQFSDYRETTQRISELDNAFDGTPVTEKFLRDYEKARQHYRKEFKMYLEDASPFSKFDNVSIDGRQRVSGHRLFELFHKEGMDSNDFETVAREFDQVFYNDSTGKYKRYPVFEDDGTTPILDENGAQVMADPIEDLVYSFATRIVNNYENPNPKAIDDVIGDSLLYFTPILEKAGYGKFVETIKGYVKYNSVKLDADDADKDTVTNAIYAVINKADEMKRKAFDASAISKLGGGQGLQEYGVIIDEGLKSLRDYQANLLLRGGGSINFNAHDYFYNTLKKSDSFQKATSKQKRILEEIIYSEDFKRTLREMSGPEVAGGESALFVALQDAQAKVKQGVLNPEEFERLKVSSRTMIFDNFGNTAFPFVERATLVESANDASSLPGGMSKTTREAIQRVAVANDTSPRKVRSMLKAGDQGIRKQLRDQGLSEAQLRMGYRINLNNTFDPVAAQNWWKENRDILELTYKDKNGVISKEGKAHLDALDSFLQFGTSLTTFGLKQSIKNIPMPYTVQMALGRVYNSIGKRVVSPTYIGMENIVINYRLMQAGIIKDILSNPSTTKIFQDIYSKGLFKPRDIKDFIRDMTVRVAQFGGKMSFNQQDALMNFFAEEARVTKRLLQEEKDASVIEERDDDIDYSTFYRAPENSIQIGQSYNKATGEFTDITQELPD